MPATEVNALDEKLTIASKPVYGPKPQSPDASGDDPLLAFNLLPATSERGEPTVALFAAAKVAGRMADVYGGRAAGAIEIVAVDLSTGEIFHNRGERGHAAPISAVMHPDPSPPKPGAARIDSIEIYFAIDLRAHLNLPSRSAFYSVFLWLDEMTSVVQTVQVPGSVENNAGNAGPSNAVRFVPVTGKPAGPPNGIILQESAGLFRGEIGAVALSKPAPSGRKYLALFALDYRSREFASLSAEVNPGSPGVAFQFSRPNLFNGPGWLDAPSGSRKVFVVAACGEVLSPVLIFGG